MRYLPQTLLPFLTIDGMLFYADVAYPLARVRTASPSVPCSVIPERIFGLRRPHVLIQVIGTSEIIVRPGLMNVDFADVRQVIKSSGTALIGIGTGTGKVRFGGWQ